MSEQIALVVDVEQRRPACVLLQAVYGCPSGLVGRLFDSGSWLTSPTPGMQRVSGTREQWDAFAGWVNERARAGEFRP